MMPLDDVKVLDLTRLMPGYTTTLLADLGADVIKVEEPAKGDWLRELGPLTASGEGYAFCMMHRNKRGIALNLKSAEGVAIFTRLAAAADVVVESFRPGVMARLGLGYEMLARDNPGLVYCAISGFGQSGPYRDIPGHDTNYVAITGLASMSHASEDGPAELPTPLADFDACQRAAMAILGALHVRHRTGRGQFIDIAMMEGVPTWLFQAYADYFGSGRMPDPDAYMWPGGARFVGRRPGYGFYPTADGCLALGAAEPHFWRALCEVAGLAHLADKRETEESAAIDARLRALMRTRPSAEWVALFERADVPFAPVNDLAAATRDPQLAARGVFVEVDHPRAGRLRQIASPVRLEGSAPPDRRPSPALGEHSDEVLRELGYTGAAIAGLRARGVV